MRETQIDKGEESTHSECAQLSRGSCLPDSHNLRELAGNTQRTSASLEVAQRLHVQDILAKERDGCSSQSGDEDRGGGGLAGEVQHQDRDDHILHRNQRRLAVGAKRELLAVVICEGDQEGRGLEEIGEERNALGRARLEQLEDLRDLDNRRRGDDADSQPLGDGELDAFRGGRVDIQQQRLVALVAYDGDSEVANRRGKVVRDGLES